tara:strand:+ start:250948 stop:255207 length:4260 start_codon:yes stop_codon:yes gene_type:complete
MMKKHILLLTAQIFLVNSLYVAPANAGMLDWFKSKFRTEKPQEATAPESSSQKPSKIQITSFARDNARFTRLIVNDKPALEFADSDLAAAIEEVKKMGIPQLTEADLKSASMGEKLLAQTTKNYHPNIVFGILEKNNKLVQLTGNESTPVSDETPTPKPKEKKVDGAKVFAEAAKSAKYSYNGVAIKLGEQGYKADIKGNPLARNTKGYSFTMNSGVSQGTYASVSYGAQESLKATPSQSLSQTQAVNESLQFRSTLSPEGKLGSGIDVDMSFSQVDSDNDGKQETVAKAESVKIEESSAAERKILADHFKPSELRKLLAQDRRDMVKNMVRDRLDEIRRAKKMAPVPEWQKTTWGAQTRRFPMETVMFFISIGLINGGMLMNDFAQNPLIMDQHLQTLTDPIGHLSFYSFMIVNGYATEFLTSGAMSNKAVTDEMMKALAKNETSRVAMAAAMRTTDPVVREKLLNEIADEATKLADRKGSLNPYSNSVAKKAYMKIIPYLGMTAGSMASHISGDFLRTLQSCATSLYKDPKSMQQQQGQPEAGEAAGQGKVKDRLNGLSEDACDVAWREWVMEKKFNTYAPALVSMVLSTMGSGAITSLAGKVKTSGPYNSIGEALAKSKQAVLGKLRLEGAEIGTGVISSMFGGVWTKTMKFIAHLSSITLFTALDTIMHSWVEDKVLNFSMGRYYLWPNIDAFPRKAELLNTLLTKEAAEKFQKDSVACEKDLQSADCRRNDIEGWLYDFNQAMLKWREFNQTKAKQAHTQWIDKINKFQDMERFSKSFYERFMLDLKNANLCRTHQDECGKIKDKSQTDAEILDGFEEDALFTKLDLLYLNYRQYPLYGVEPDPSIKLANEKAWKNNYLQNPSDLQKAQQITVQKVAVQLETYLASKGWDSSDLKGSTDKLKEIIAGLKSEDLLKVGTAINLMRSMTVASKGQVNEIVQAILRDHLNKMGYPAPLLYYGQGFPYAFESHESNKELVKRVELPEFYRNVRLSTQFKFEKKTDFLFYQMLCGPNPEKGQAVHDNTLGNMYGYGLLGFRDLFVPPRIVSDKLQLDICTDRMTFQSSGEMYGQWILDESENIKYPGAFSVIDKNLTDSMKSIINSTKFDLDDADKKNPSAVLNQPMFNMSVWWEKYVENQVSKQLETFKNQYESIAVKFLEAQFKDVGTLLGVPLNSSVVRNSVVASSMQESRVYSLVLAEVLRKYIPESDAAKVYATNSALDSYKSYKKMGSAEDIITIQAQPFNQDLNAIKNGTAPKLFKFQLQNEEILRLAYTALKNAEVINKPDINGKDRAVVDLKMDEKQVDALEKQIEEQLKVMSQEIDTLTKYVKAQGANGERAKPLRIIEFTKNQMNQIARELVATLSTIQFAGNAARQYSLKGDSEEQKRLAEKAQRENQRKECIKTKGAAGITGGGGC